MIVIPRSIWLTNVLSDKKYTVNCTYSHGRVLETPWKFYKKKNGKKFGAGHLEVISLADLRKRVTSISPTEKNSFVHMHQAGDVKKHLTDPANQNSLFQVASQFNLLEMASPAMTPERGVDIYYNDPTQGEGSSDGPNRVVWLGYVRVTLKRPCMFCLCHWGNPLSKLFRPCW